MKSSLVKRFAAAVAFAGIATFLSGCGSSNGTPGVGGILGPQIPNGTGCTGLTQAVAFSGVAQMDNMGNLYAGQNVGPLSLSGAGAVQPGGYQFGRINTTDGSTLEFNISGSYGQQMTIQGVYVMGQDVMTVLGSMGGSMGYGYGYPTGYPTGYPSGYPGYGSPYGQGGCGVSSLMLSQMGTEPMMQAASVIGNQPFTYAIVSGQLILNGSINAPY